MWGGGAQKFLGLRGVKYLNTVLVKIHRTIIFPFVLCGCETWSPTGSEEHRLRVFRNRVLRKIFGPTGD